MFNFANSYLSLPKSFYSFVEAQKFENVELVEFNNELANILNIDVSCVSNKNLAKIFSGQIKLKNGAYIAFVYAGHQFAYFVPKLGDGRAILLGEHLDKANNRFDIQLKGAGITPYSRRGDGKSQIGPVIREYILSEAMHHLGIPTTRSLAIVKTGETIYRDEAKPGAVFTRLAKSHIRIGTFEYFNNIKDYDSLTLLINYTINRLYPCFKDEDNKIILFFREFIKKQAELIAAWMAYGFIHGVMNTDNTSISSETIDYGPCAFIDEFKFDKVFSSIDYYGRYSYKNQPSIMLWNLKVFANTLASILDTENKEELLELELEKFNIIYNKSYLNLMFKKMGVYTKEYQDESLVNEFLNFLEKESLDYTSSFRNIKNIIFGNSINFPATFEFLDFKEKLLSIIKKENIYKDILIKNLDAINPIYIPRNHLVQTAIKEAELGNYNYFKELNKALAKPFTEHKEFIKYSLAPEPHERVYKTFCGT